MIDVSTVSSNAASCCLLNAFCSRLNTRSADAELGCTNKIFLTAAYNFGRLADHLGLLPQADHQGNSVYAKSCIKTTVSHSIGLIVYFSLLIVIWAKIRLHSTAVSTLQNIVQHYKTLSSNTSLHFTIFQHWKGEWGCWHLFCRYYDYNFMFLTFSNTICPRL